MHTPSETVCERWTRFEETKIGEEGYILTRSNTMNKKHPEGE